MYIYIYIYIACKRPLITDTGFSGKSVNFSLKWKKNNATCFVLKESITCLAFWKSVNSSLKQKKYNLFRVKKALLAGVSGVINQTAAWKRNAWSVLIRTEVIQ